MNYEVVVFRLKCIEMYVGRKHYTTTYTDNRFTVVFIETVNNKQNSYTATYSIEISSKGTIVCLYIPADVMDRLLVPVDICFSSATIRLGDP